MTSKILGLLPILALLSCSTAPKMDPLEAKAAEGDPVAACQFAARTIHICALERQKWERGVISVKPACLGDPAGAKAESYLDHAYEKLKGNSSSISELKDQIALLGMSTSRVVLSVASVVVTAGPADHAVETTKDLHQKCLDLNGEGGA